MTQQEKHITAVILAAGQSKRMGQAKLLLPWGEQTILETTIAHLKASNARDLLLVSGGYRQAVEQLAEKHEVPIVYNPQFAIGEMLSSLQTAVAHLTISPSPPDAILIMLGDLPFITTEIINQIIACYQAQDTAVVAPVHNGRRGHPVLLSASLFASLIALPAGSAPRDLLKKQQQETTFLEIDTDVILRDIDTPEAYKKWAPQSNQ